MEGKRNNTTLRSTKNDESQYLLLFHGKGDRTERPSARRSRDESLELTKEASLLLSVFLTSKLHVHPLRLSGSNVEKQSWTK